MHATALIDEINDGAAFYGLLLALDTLFTAELQRAVQALDDLHAPKKSRLKTVERVTAGLLVLTVTSFVALSEWGIETLTTIGDGSDFQPGLAIFEISWLLLVGLIAWQVVIVTRAHSIRDSDRAV